MHAGLMEALRRVGRICEIGFANHDPSHYAEIRRELEPYRETPGVSKMLGLCEAGPKLSSKRFAYPHIQSDAQDMITELGDDAGTPRP